MPSYQSGGAFLTGGDYQPTGTWDYSKAAAVTGIPATALGSGTVGTPQLTPNTSAGLSAAVVAHATYSFAVDGGAVSTITPKSGATLPTKAIITNVTVNFSTAGTSGGSATFSVGTSAGSSTTALLGATAVASCTGLLVGTPTPAAPIQLTAAGNITVSIAVATFTAGVAEIYVSYFNSPT